MKLPFCIFAALVVLCCVLPGCAEDDVQTAYTVYQADGCWYIKTDAGLPESVADAHGDEELLRSMAGQWCRYESVAQLREEVLRGGLRQRHLQWLQCTAYPDKPILICDMEALYEPVFPEELMYDYVLFKGDCLEFPVWQSRTGVSRGSVYIYYDSKEYLALFQNYKGGADAPCLTFDGEVPNRPARALLDEQGIALNEGALYYELDTGNGVMFVCEPPVNGDIHGGIVEIFGAKGTMFFRIVIHCQGPVPTVRWLSQFGIKPLEGAY